MQSYINQLLEDIENAHQVENEPGESTTPFPFAFEDEFADIERWMDHEPVHAFSYYCGLEKIQFPPAHMLSKKQMRQLSKAFITLLNSWNLGVNFPKKFPLENKYALLTGVLDEKTNIVKDGFMIFEFCTCHPPSCPFGEYCRCKKWEVETSKHKTMGSRPPDIDIPF